MSAHFKVDAILPAGGRIAGAFAAEAGAEVKALISFGGQTMLERTLLALRDAGCVGRMVVVGPDEVAAHPAARAADAVLTEGNSGPENIFRGLDWLYQSNGGRHAERVLIVTTDLPFLTPQMITDFLNACPREADICIPIIRREDCEARFPHAPGTYVGLRDGAWTMGCAFLVNPQAIANNRAYLERIFDARKSQLAMARLLGITFIIRLLTRQLTIAHVEERCQQMLHCKGVAVHGCAPELAFDVDQQEEYHYVVEQMHERKPQP
jgi:GTP:adenosylcobinamide-phosphate guanylyltransferase